MSIKATTLAVIISALGTTAVMADAPRGRAMMPAFDFAAADTDQSGALSQEEFGTYLRVLGDQMRSERAGMRAAALIDAGDADGDGLLSAEELQTGMETLRAARAEDSDGHRRGHGMMRRHARGGDAEQMDARREHRMARMFDRIDDNGDGSIDAGELAQAQERMAERMAERMERRQNG